MLEINIFASLNSIILFFLLFFRKNNSLPNKILAVAFLIPGFNFLNNIHILSAGMYDLPWTYFLVQISAAFFAPLSYYYIRLMTGRTHPEWHKWLMVISGSIVGYGGYIWIQFALKTPVAQHAYIHGVMNGPYPADMLVYSGLFFLHQLFYFSLNAKEVRQYRKEMIQSVSSLSSVKITYLIRFTGMLWVLTFATIILYLTAETTYVEYVHLPLVMTGIFLFILYYAFNQHVVFTRAEYHHHLKQLHTAGQIAAIPDNVLQVKVNKDNSLCLYEKVRQLIVDKLLYRRTEISLHYLAAYTRIPAYQIADAFKSAGTSFYETIRRIRVEKAKELLIDKNCHFTIEAIAYEVGFNSRASFYRAFKKYEKADPSALLAQKT